MSANPDKQGNSAQAAPVFVTQEQFEAATSKLVNSFVSENQKAIEQLFIKLNPQKPEPSAPVANGGNTSPTREQVFNDSMKKVVEWFGKIKKNPIATENGSLSWSVPTDIMLKSMGYDVEADVDTKKATEDVTFQSGTKMTKYVKRFIYLKGGRFITPVRQYCDFQFLEDAETAQWFTFNGGYDFGVITEGSAPTAVISTIDKKTATPSVSGGFQKVKYTDIELAPAPLVDAINRAATVAAMADESKDLLTTAVDAVTPDNWVNGNTGAVITADATFANTNTLKVKGILAAKKLIIRKIGEPAINNLVLFIGTQAYQDLLFDVVSYTQYTRASEIDQGTVERVVGADLVVTDNISRDPTTNTRERNILAVKGEAFGMTSGRDLSMEASRRNELQQVYLTANHRVKSVVLNNEAWCRISSYLN